MRVYVHEAHGQPSRSSRAEQTTEHNAAVAAEDENKGAVVSSGANFRGKLARVIRDVVLVSRLARGTHEVAVRCRNDVAEIARAKARCYPLVPEDAWREVEAAHAALVVGTYADARRCAYDCDGTIHGERI